MTMIGRLFLLFGAVAACSVLASGAYARGDKKTVASGKTQVVATAGGREITLSELRVEMARLGVSPADPNGERTALDSILNRVLLAKEARTAKLQRRPEAIVRMRAAADQALADYYLGIASQPPEPSRAEIEDFIGANPSLFGERKTYRFSVISLPTEAFDEDVLTPLFDEETDFSRLSNALEEVETIYSISDAIQPALAFPKPIREQLAAYDVKDNIVLRGDEQTQIMKILEVRDSVGDPRDWAPLARRALMAEAAGARAQKLVESLKTKSNVTYHRPSASPLPAEAVSALKAE